MGGGIGEKGEGPLGLRKALWSQQRPVEGTKIMLYSIIVTAQMQASFLLQISPALSFATPFPKTIVHVCPGGRAVYLLRHGAPGRIVRLLLLAGRAVPRRKADAQGPRGGGAVAVPGRRPSVHQHPQVGRGHRGRAGGGARAASGACGGSAC